MTTVVTAPHSRTIPDRPELHLRMQQHEQQRSKLAADVAAIHEMIAQSTTERDRLITQQQDREARALIGEADAEAPDSGGPDLPARIIELQETVARASVRLVPLAKALQLLDARGPELLATVRAEMAPEVRAAADDTIARMARLFRELVPLNAELRRLEQTGCLTLTVNAWPDLLDTYEGAGKATRWIAQARQAGCDVD